MVNKEFVIAKKVRERFGKGRKIYNYLLGGLLLMLGLINIAKQEYSIQNTKAILNEALVLMGILSILSAWVGKELFRTKHQLRMDDETIRLKKSFDGETLIMLKNVSSAKVISQKIEFTMTDYIKTYDFDWMTREDFERFKTKLSEYCMKENIVIE